MHLVINGFVLTVRSSLTVTFSLFFFTYIFLTPQSFLLILFAFSFADLSAYKISDQ